MIYSDRDIRRLLIEGEIRITPSPDLITQLGSCSLDLRLGNEFSIFNFNKFAYIDVLDPEQRQHTQEVVIQNDEKFFLHPQTFVLASTIERVELADDIVARLEGRSSLGRLGVIVHATASIIDPGFKGKIVLELANHGTMPVALYTGMRICSLTFEAVSTKVDTPYWKKTGAKYVDQSGPIGSRISTESDRLEAEARSGVYRNGHYPASKE